MASMTRNKRATITNNMVRTTTMLEMKRKEITTRETTTTNYIKKTEYYDKEERGVVVEGTEIRAEGDKEDEEETS
ncbi:hypothetical protein B7P43_G07010 [Cryptotermes secundus]|uniref:Uncharacterized protein n=1 Tax=Cryptotermes secundus TaxID=105785 RepID=A0A2J7PEP9_9NEOP|nr:hypothetical protein B7P43_G07010 [Cryptotermes secundus]